MSHSFLQTLKQAARFGVVGILATAVHAGIGYLAVTQLGVSGLIANATGFAVAWWVSFFGHYAFTFEAQSGPMVALKRFIPHSLAMFGLGMLLTATIAAAGPSIPQEVLPILGALAMPIISFLSSKFFVFRV